MCERGWRAYLRCSPCVVVGGLCFVLHFVLFRVGGCNILLLALLVLTGASARLVVAGADVLASRDQTQVRDVYLYLLLLVVHIIFIIG